MMCDKTLRQNRNVFAAEMEDELISNIVEVALNISKDVNEPEGSGTLIWVVLCLKTLLMQRDKINQLEYVVSQLEKKLDPAVFESLINQELDRRAKNG